MSSLPAMPRKATGSVTLRPDGMWRVRVTIDGKRRDLAPCATEDEGWRLVAAARMLVPCGSGPMTLSRWGAAYLDRRELDGLHRSVSKDRDRWRARIETAPFALAPLRQLSARDVRQWVDGMVQEGLKRPTICNALNLLRVALEAACDAGHLDVNPARGVRVPRLAVTEDAGTVLTDDECAALLSCERIPLDVRRFYAVALYTGARPGELYGLHWRDVHVGKREPHPRITIRYSREQPTKTGRPREVPLLPPALDALRSMTRGLPGVLVWPSETGGVRGHGDDMGWQTYAKRAGVDHARLYDLRHTCASAMVSGRWGRVWTLVEVQHVLGHTTIRTTERYAKYAPGNLHDAAAEASAKWPKIGPNVQR